MTAQEVNFDGLVGPSHNYAGLSDGNLASKNNEGKISNPRQGALEGLEKMAFLSGLGLMQGVLPPHERPHLASLRALGFQGGDAHIIATAAAESPALLANVSSASAMWTANAATVSPSADTRDGRTHFTPANLAAMFHRSIEAPVTGRVLKAIFPEGQQFAHHAPLAGGVHMGDEGAANHNRFCRAYGEQGIELFVYGRKAFGGQSGLKYPARQTFEASAAVARHHTLDPQFTVFVEQNPAAINAGAFHNDVVAVSNQNVFFYHQDAFADPAGLQKDLQWAADWLKNPAELAFVEVPRSQVSLEDAVSSYLFNSQLVSVPGEAAMTLILPSEARETPSVKAYVDTLLASGGPIGAAHYLDVRQSMRNGGGPACLRLRVVLSEAELAAIDANVILNERLLGELKSWVGRRYRDHLSAKDLQDPLFATETMEALDELTQILNLGSVYDFQQA